MHAAVQCAMVITPTPMPMRSPHVRLTLSAPPHPPNTEMASFEFTAGGGFEFTFEAPASSTDITFTPGGGFSLSYEPRPVPSTTEVKP